MADKNLDQAKETLFAAGRKLTQVSRDVAKQTVELSSQAAQKAVELSSQAAEQIGNAYEYTVISGILAQPIKKLTLEQKKLLKNFRREIEFKSSISQEYFDQAREEFVTKLLEVANESLAELPNEIRARKVLAGYTYDDSLIESLERADESQIAYVSDLQLKLSDTDKLKSVTKQTATALADKYGTKALSALAPKIVKKLGSKGASKAIGNIPVVGIALSFAVDEAVERGDRLVKLQQESIAFYKATGLQDYFMDVLAQTSIVINSFKESLEESGQELNQTELDEKIDNSLDSK